MRKTIFHEEWWLDAVAPGAWTSLDVESGGRVVARMPFVETRSRLFRSCRMPPLTRVLGPVLPVEGAKTESNNRAAFAALSLLIERLRPYDHVNFSLAPGEVGVTAFQMNGFHIRVENTFLIDCVRPLDALWAELRDKTRNVIRRAREKLRVVEQADADAFSAVYRANLGARRSYFDTALIAPIHAAASAREQGKMLAAVDDAGETHAEVMLIWDERSCYYFLSSRDPGRADLGAVSLLVWAGVEEAHRRGVTFDLDGVVSEPHYKFLVGFGGTHAARLVVERNAPAFAAATSVRRWMSALSRPGTGEDA